MATNEHTNKRRSESPLYEIIDNEIELRRNELKKQKAYKRKIRLSQADYIFLQYHALIRKWALKNYNITPTGLDLLLYVYPITIFSSTEFRKMQKELGRGTPALFNKLKNEGWVIPWSKVKRKQYYVLSNKANTLIARLHRMYILEEKIPISNSKNTFARSVKKRDKAVMDLFKMFNDKVTENK